MRSVSAVVLIAALAASPAALAEEEGHENWLAGDELDLGDAVVELKSAIAQDDKINLKADVKNAGTDWIFLKKHELVFKAGDQTLKPWDGNEKPPLVIPPEKSKGLSVAVKGAGLHVEELTVDFQGMYKASSTGEPVEAADFQLPPTTNNVTYGNFDCSVTYHDQATKVTKTQWECTYTGDGIGYIDPAKLGVKIQTGQEFASTFRKNKTAMLEHNEKAKFTTTFEVEKRIVDMQFATMQILWRDTFSEAKLQPIDSMEWDLEIDEALTAEKND